MEARGCVFHGENEVYAKHQIENTGENLGATINGSKYLHLQGNQYELVQPIREPLTPIF
jgi:hypothetical protein